ncbi:unnamed protein product [Diamesa serratosioi]
MPVSSDDFEEPPAKCCKICDDTSHRDIWNIKVDRDILDTIKDKFPNWFSSTSYLNTVATTSKLASAQLTFTDFFNTMSNDSKMIKTYSLPLELFCDNETRQSSPKAIVDSSPLDQSTMDKNRESLKVKLMVRRSVNQLVEQGIMPPLKTSPAIHEQKKLLERAKTGDLLKAKIQQRPDRQELERRHILDTNEGHIDPSLADKYRMLEKAILVDQLNSKISHRPGPLELIEKNILHADEPIERIVKEGLVPFKLSTEDIASSSSFLSFEDDSQSSEGDLCLSPMQQNPQQQQNIPESLNKQCIKIEQHDEHHDKIQKQVQTNELRNAAESTGIVNLSVEKTKNESIPNITMAEKVSNFQITPTYKTKPTNVAYSILSSEIPPPPPPPIKTEIITYHISHLQSKGFALTSSSNNVFLPILQELSPVSVCSNISSMSPDSSIASQSPITVSTCKPNISALLQSNNQKYGAPGKDKNRKKTKNKPVSKMRAIKFHEYKGPPNSQKNASCSSSLLSASSSLASATARKSGETNYELILQQQCLLEYLEGIYKHPPILSATMKPNSNTESNLNLLNVSTVSEMKQNVIELANVNNNVQNMNIPEKPLTPTSKMKVSELKSHLKKLNLPVSGPKPLLIERLKPFLPLNSSEHNLISITNAIKNNKDTMVTSSTVSTKEDDIVREQQRKIEELQRKLLESQHELEQMKQIQNIDIFSNSPAHKSSGSFTKKHKKTLPLALQGLMGQANLCYARGDVQIAEKLCLEIIRQAPMAAEPYLTLSQIYETTDESKYLQFLLIAAHLNSTVVQWIRIAEISMEKGNVKQAISCYTKAIRCDPKDISLRMKRIDLLKQIGEEKHVLRCYFCMLSFIPKNQHEFLIKTAKMVAHKFHHENNLQLALEAMTKAYSKASAHFQTEDINLLLELLISDGQYRKALNVLVFHTSINIKVLAINKKNEQYEYSDIFIPEDLLLDFRTKLCVSLIHLKAHSLIDILVNNMLSFVDIETAGDCILDIAEALMKEKQFSDALRLLDPLVKSQEFSLAAVWLRHADCLRSIEKFDDAIESYKTVVKMAVGHLDARLTLSALLKKQGRMEESLEALTQDPQSEILDPELLYEKCLLLKELNKVEEYLENGYLLMLRHCAHFRSRIELQTVFFAKVNDRVNELKSFRKTREQNYEDIDTPEFSKSTNELSTADDWNFYLDLVKTAYEHKKFGKLQRLAFACMSSKKLQTHLRQIDFIGVLACLYNREECFGYNKVKDFVNTDMKYPRFWNIFNLIIYITQDCRYNRFLIRAFDRNNVHPMAYMIVANYFLMSNSYKYALNHYDEVFKRFEVPMISLIMSIVYVQIASQKYTSKKQYLVVQAIAHIEKYHTSREPEALAEVYYNKGRLFHQIGLISSAKSYYEKALKVSNMLIEKYPQYLDLRMEIAFNLHLIYKLSGNKELARKILYDYISI